MLIAHTINNIRWEAIARVIIGSKACKISVNPYAKGGATMVNTYALAPNSVFHVVSLVTASELPLGIFQKRFMEYLWNIPLPLRGGANLHSGIFVEYSWRLFSVTRVLIPGCTHLCTYFFFISGISVEYSTFIPYLFHFWPWNIPYIFHFSHGGRAFQQLGYELFHIYPYVRSAYKGFSYFMMEYSRNIPGIFLGVPPHRGQKFAKSRDRSGIFVEYST